MPLKSSDVKMEFGFSLFGKLNVAKALSLFSAVFLLLSGANPVSCRHLMDSQPSALSGSAESRQSNMFASAIVTPTPVYMNLSSEPNPFLRAKRDAANPSCSLPADLPDKVRELNSFLSESTFLSVMPDDAKVTLPSDQPTSWTCPIPEGTYDSRTEENLRNSCPWVWEKKFTGDNTYPSFIKEAQCMCDTCIGANTHTCSKIRGDITAFRLTGCTEEGVAVLEKVIYTITLGCYCLAPAPNNGGSAGSGIIFPVSD